MNRQIPSGLNEQSLLTLANAFLRRLRQSVDLEATDFSNRPRFDVGPMT
jgi:hypothetical protein